MCIFGHLFLSDMGGRVHDSNLSVQQTVILEDAVINGDIRVSGNLLLNGKVNGNICCKHRVVMQAGAFVQGDVTCTELDLESEVTGSVKAKNVILKKGACVRGDIETSRLKVITEEISIGRLRLTDNENNQY